ncbi:MAG: helix-turn-helix domain-containing protein [Candidatus Methylomirabilota bacterium]
MAEKVEIRETAPAERTRGVRLTGEERRRQIVEAAAALFARKGFRGTKTREIAQAVGVSEAMLFKHFATKEELYAAIIEAKIQGPGIMDRLVQAAEQNDDALVLRTLARKMIDLTRDDPTLLRLIFFSALEGHALSDMIFRSRVQQLDDFLRRYIARRVAEGAFRRLDPLQAARSFVGMVGHFMQLQELFKQPLPPHLTPEAAVEEMIALFLEGCRA